MARWDEILSLPVQNPPSLEFSAADLVWSKVEGWRDNIDTIALIQFARVDDFVRGESSNTDCPTRFHVEARRRRSPQTPYKPKVDGILEYILYWCSFGPDDHRTGGVVRPSRTTYVPKRNTAGRPNTKRGCTCHFIVKRLIAEPSVALIIYNQDKHVDKKGVPCHGPQDKKAAGTRAMYAPYISEDLRLRVFSLLYVGVPVEAIMERHNECVKQQGGPCSRDDLLTHRYVRRQERSIRLSTYELDEDDAVSVGLWLHSHQNNIFFYEDFSESGPLILGIQTEWQLQQMIMFGNRSLLLWDCRLGTNKLKYLLQSLLVFNADNKAIPVAWIISPRFSTGDAYRWMMALYNRVRTKDPTWNPAGFVVDDPLADIRTIRDVFECSVLISFWRVRYSWRKHLERACLDIDTCVDLFKWLGKAVRDISTGDATVASFDNFLKLFGHASYFAEYFKAVWRHRIESWATALQTFPLASQETGAAIEFYHNQMKLRLLGGEDDLHHIHRRADWLVYRLATRVHSYFWLDEYPEKDVFLHFLKQERVFEPTPWQKASLIPDSSITLEEDGYTMLVSGCDDAVVRVGNPGSEFGVCDCNSAKTGNMCEHVLKTIMMKRVSAPSIALRRYNQALLDILFRAPLDSLVQDHGVSLAVSVQSLLNSPSGRSTFPIQEELADESCCMEEIIPPEDHGDGLNVGHGSCGESRNGSSHPADVCSSLTMECLVKCDGNGFIQKPK